MFNCSYGAVLLHHQFISRLGYYIMWKREMKHLPVAYRDWAELFQKIIPRAE